MVNVEASRTSSTNRAPTALCSHELVVLLWRQSVDGEVRLPARFFGGGCIPPPLGVTRFAHAARDVRLVRVTGRSPPSRLVVAGLTERARVAAAVGMTVCA